MHPDFADEYTPILHNIISGVFNNKRAINETTYSSISKGKSYFVSLGDNRIDFGKYAMSLFEDVVFSVLYGACYMAASDKLIEAAFMGNIKAVVIWQYIEKERLLYETSKRTSRRTT